jgi:alkanesulfonate monooxygenase SsuD/methylene tetrahydromethanopterin reductase-like flavin-dependent oxidoreductase (luciferase family)
MNAETGRYVDPSKFREFEFNGKYYKSRGPLNVSRSPQGRPVICQAGSSPAGKAFAAKHSDVVLFSNFGEFNLQGMIDFRNDIKRLAKEAGRNPDDVKVMYLISPVVGDTERAAQERYTEIVTMTPAVLKRRLGLLTLHTNYDWTQFDLDKPLPPIDPAQFTEGFQGLVGNIVRMASKKTLREALSEQETTSLKLIGTPEQVADMMEDAMEKLGGDGFLMHARPLTRRYLAEILDGLVPILQKRGLVRTEYSGKTFRENMQAF